MDLDEAAQLVLAFALDPLLVPGTEAEAHAVDIAALDARIASAAPANDSQLSEGPARTEAANAVEYESHEGEAH